MCLAVPAKIVDLHDAGARATVDLDGVRQNVSLALIEDAKVGEFVLVHVGFALNKISQQEAEATLALFTQIRV